MGSPLFNIFQKDLYRLKIHTIIAVNIRLDVASISELKDNNRIIWPMFKGLSWVLSIKSCLTIDRLVVMRVHKVASVFYCPLNIAYMFGCLSSVPFALPSRLCGILQLDQLLLALTVNLGNFS